MKTKPGKHIVWIVLCLAGIVDAWACGPSYDPDSEYYNLFMQEIIDDPQYYPFLLSFSSPYYESKKPVKNENIEEWQEYFESSYEDAFYLVLKAGENDLRKVLEGAGTADPELCFITSSFRKKYKEALEYLVYAKYLEPYMSVIPEDTWWYEPVRLITELDYQEVTSTLEKRWKKTRDKELKLRYGYQLVRFAHYNRKYEEAIAYFDRYVESLDFRPAMYYHALSQKAGAERGNGDISLANYHFLQVFSHSKNLKETAVNSIRLNENADWEELVEHAQNQKELNDAYLLLGYNSFNNPLSEIRKIVKNTPDAIQAKVLMTRAINRIEREDLALYYYWYSGEREEQIPGDKRYPRSVSVTDEIVAFSDEMTRNPEAGDKNFWFMTSAYLHFLRKNFTQARKYLYQVEEVNEKYTLQKRNLSFYIDISEPTVVTPELEVVFYEKYNALLAEGNLVSRWIAEDYYEPLSTSDFVRDVLANRYFLQKDYAKSFLLTNSISELERNPRLDLLDELEAFYRKPRKNSMEGLIAGNFSLTDWKGDVVSYLSYLRGIVHLTQGNLYQAHGAFQKIDPEVFPLNIPDYVLGVNIAECMNCDPDKVMGRAYLSEFSFIQENMNFKELTDMLLKLEEAGKGKGALAAKANYLLGNFFYNISAMGYYRHVPRFQSDNYYSYRYCIYEEPDVYGGIYFKYYSTYYENSYPLSQKYLQVAYRQATGGELKARIVFALSKCEQEEHNTGKEAAGSYYWYRSDDILISDRQYFKELLKYRNTEYFREVESNCKYFGYYVSKSGLSS